LYKHHTDGDDDDFTFFFYGNFGAGGIKVIPTCFHSTYSGKLMGARGGALQV
jgi:hypothetical protein